MTSRDTAITIYHARLEEAYATVGRLVSTEPNEPDDTSEEDTLPDPDEEHDYR